MNPTQAPEPVSELIRGAVIEPSRVRNDGQCSTWRVVRPSGDVLYLKVDRHLGPEVERLRWLVGRLPVPRVEAWAEDADGFGWLVTRAIPGASASSLAADAEVDWLIDLLADALRLVHSLPVEDCPFDSTTERLIATAEDHIRRGSVEQVWDHDRGTWVDASAAFERLMTRRPEAGGLVVVHGDYCLPNVMVAEHRLSGYLDVGSVGRGDPWVDLVACADSGRRNLGKRWDGQRFFHRYGLAPDPARLRWFRLLSDLSPL